eukprot:6179123-Pleurochrysis_carterae.AAC.1
MAVGHRNMQTADSCNASPSNESAQMHAHIVPAVLAADPCTLHARRKCRRSSNAYTGYPYIIVRRSSVIRLRDGTPQFRRQNWCGVQPKRRIFQCSQLRLCPAG